MVRMNENRGSNTKRRRPFFGAATGLLLLCAMIHQEAMAATSVTDQTSESFSVETGGPGGLRLLDWLVIGAYVVGLLAVGWKFSRKTRTTDDYLLGGRRMKSSAIGLSLFATLLSAISYLAIPGEMIKHGPVIMCEIVATPIFFCLVGYVLIPHIMKFKVTSAYELLEGRLGFKVRLLGALIFLMIRLVWMSLLTYLTADKVIVVLMGWTSDATPYVCGAIGLITVVYTSIGGIRAVVFADVLQTFILFFGAILSLVLITVRMGGVGAWWPTEWASNWDDQPFFSLNPHVRATIFGTTLNFVLWWICTAGSDQMAIQRYLSTRDAKAARRSFLVTSISLSLVYTLLGVLGLALLAYFRAHPELTSAGANLTGNADGLFPSFIANTLPVGIAGLVVSALLAAAMSSLSSGLNSVSAVVTVDLIEPIYRKKIPEQRRVRRARFVAFGVGIAVVLMSSQIGKIPGNLVEVTSKTSNLFVAPLFGLFFLAMFVRFATPFGAVFGTLYGIVAAALIGYWDLITGQEPISFQWILPVSMGVNIGAGVLLSLLPTRDRPWTILSSWGVIVAIPLVAVVVLVCGL